MPTKLTVTRPIDFAEFAKESIFQGIHQRIEAQTRLRPGSIALKTPDAAYTYTEMNGVANSIAAEILSATGKQLAQVALLLPNTPELVLAILASLKAHKIYVPLDCNFPKERLQAMLDDAGPAVLLTDDEHLSFAEEIAGSDRRIINLSRINRDEFAPNPEVSCSPLDPAYILYTSGSTGRPKGITFLHRNLLHTTMCLTNELFFAPSDRVTWLHSPSFGSSVVDIYCCLTNGGTLCPWDAKTQGFTGMADWLIKERVSTFQWIPSAFRQFMRTVPDNAVFRDVRIVIMAGEPLTVREVELFRRHFPRGSHLVNQVGTGESYNYYLYRVDHDIPIENANVAGGYPVSEDRQLLILDDQRREMPKGSVGEIAIKSDYMSAGYWRDEALTRSKFIQLGTDPTPVYLTGDLGKLEPDGCLLHLGRKDFQVKIRGCRIEVAEVEHFLSSAPGVADSAVWIAKNRLEEDQLVGYVVEKTPGEFRQETAEKHLESKLPDYMVPRHFMVLKSLPALLTGKVNRKGLPDPFEKNQFEKKTPFTQPEAELRGIVSIFKELLRLEEVHPDSDFLKLGGDSLLAAVMIHRIHQCFGVEIDYGQFVISPTPAHLADLIKGALIGITKPRVSRPLLEGINLPVGMPQMTQRETVQFKKHGPNKNLIIISAGKFGREAFVWATQAIAQCARLKIKGFLDNRGEALNGYKYAPRIIGTVDDYRIEDGDVFVGAIGDPREKIKYYAPIIKRGGKFINLIHPLTNIGHNVQLGTGIVLGPFSSLTCDVKIGDHVSIGAFSNAAHDTVLGAWSQISSHCGINGNASLGEGVFLGSHACIIPKTKVGAWAFVGAGSVVIRDVAPGVKVFGNPAAPIGRIEGV
jgi:sugar O-acyltransferase (sialic acid O-acetyltransferase NeuD family)